MIFFIVLWQCGSVVVHVTRFRISAIVSNRLVCGCAGSSCVACDIYPFHMKGLTICLIVNNYTNVQKHNRLNIQRYSVNRYNRKPKLLS